MSLRYACQTYSWQMSLERYRGRIDHMIGVAAAAGFEGFEPEIVMLGEEWSSERLGAAIDRFGMTLAALVVAEPWLALAESGEERERADRAIAAASQLGARLVLVPLPGIDRSDARHRQLSSMACMGQLAARARDHGVASTFHPNSPFGSAFRTAEDYRVIADALPDHLGFTPDLGHIAKGGMDPLEVVREWRPRVDHLHVKDLDSSGSWAATGQGVVDIDGVLDYLEATGYEGWVTFEDESAEARLDPDSAVASNAEWIAEREKRVR